MTSHAALIFLADLHDVIEIYMTLQSTFHDVVLKFYTTSQSTLHDVAQVYLTPLAVLHDVAHILRDLSLDLALNHIIVV